MNKHKITSRTQQLGDSDEAVKAMTGSIPTAWAEPTTAAKITAEIAAIISA